jgi:cell volume regulation protein A
LGAPIFRGALVSETYRYALIVALTSAVVLVGVLANRFTARFKVPVPLLMLVCAAVAVQIFPHLPTPPERTVERVVTIALVLILFDGGMHIGWSRFRPAAGPIALVGVVGTFLTAAGGAVVLHAIFGLPWYLAVLVATAVSPTDPAVVFSVLGQRQIGGRSATILEGESGANDPVGIALMTGLVAAGTLSWAALGHVGVEFLLQMLVGAAFGIAGGAALLWFMRRVTLPSEGLYPLRTLASALLLFGVTTLAHGSGFFAVFVAGIFIGHRRAPYQREIERFHSALAGLAEIVAFVLLGLTIDLNVLVRRDVWLPGLITGVLLAVLIRPGLVGLCLVPAQLRRNERTFVLFAGLKGAVPILLGNLLLAAHLPNAERLYGIVVVVVIFSVLVQGSLVPTVALRLRLPMRQLLPEPWAMGVRLSEEPEGAHEFSVATGSAVDGRTVQDAADLAGDVWISLVVRNSQLVPVRGHTLLQAGDLVVVLADADLPTGIEDLFTRPGGPHQPADKE